MLRRRLTRRNEHWYNLLFEILLTYNRKMKHSSTGFTPADAIKPENEKIVKLNMLKHAVHQKDYNTIKVGDKVRVYRKKMRLSEKEGMFPLWSKQTFEVIKIDDNPDAGRLYYLSSKDNHT